jgi:mono/diheme cytochrome c family protein
MWMRSWLFVLAAGVYTVAAVAAQDAKTTRDGVYTSDQATRGKTFFEANCAKCHHTDATPGLPKKEGPVLAGDTFFNTWEDKSVFDLSTNIRLGMPPDGSITVDNTQAVDVIAYILHVNKLPAGQTELPADNTARAIKITRPAAGAPDR